MFDTWIEEYLRDNRALLEEGRWDEFYSQLTRDEKPSMTRVLWNCGIHPEEEGLVRIPRTFAKGLDCSTIRLPEGVMRIGGVAFKNCSQLQVVHLPKSLEVIGPSAFYGCSLLRDIYYGGSWYDFTDIEVHTNWCAGCPPITVHCTDRDVVLNEGDEE